MNVMNINRKPPTTGAGMQYFCRAPIRFFTQYPISSITAASAAVQMASALMVNTLFIKTMDMVSPSFPGGAMLPQICLQDENIIP